MSQESLLPSWAHKSALFEGRVYWLVPGFMNAHDEETCDMCAFKGLGVSAHQYRHPDVGCATSCPGAIWIEPAQSEAYIAERVARNLTNQP